MCSYSHFIICILTVVAVFIHFSFLVSLLQNNFALMRLSVCSVLVIDAWVHCLNNIILKYNDNLSFKCPPKSNRDRSSILKLTDSKYQQQQHQQEKSYLSMSKMKFIKFNFTVIDFIIGFSDSVFRLWKHHQHHHHHL